MRDVLDAHDRATVVVVVHNNREVTTAPVLAHDLGAVRGNVDHLAGDAGSDQAAGRERSPGRHGEVDAQWFVIRPGQAAAALATVTAHADSADETERAGRFRPLTS